MWRQGAGTSEKVLDRKLKAMALASLNALGGHLAAKPRNDEPRGSAFELRWAPPPRVRRAAPVDHGRVTNSRSGRGQAARCRKTTVNGGHSRLTKPQVRAHIGCSDAPLKIA